MKNLARDSQGNIRYRDFDFSGLLRKKVQEKLDQIGLSDTKVVDKNIGYEMRACSPNPFDLQFTRELGYGVVDQLLEKKRSGMITKQNDMFVMQDLDAYIDKKTGETSVRFVSRDSSVYKVARKYMIRLEKADFEDVSGLTSFLNLSEKDFVEEFSDIII